MNLPKTLLALTIGSLLSACSLMGEDDVVTQTNNNTTGHGLSAHGSNVHNSNSHSSNSHNPADIYNSVANSSNALFDNEVQQAQSAPLKDDASFSTKYRQLLKQNQLREQLITKLAAHQKHADKSNQPSNQDLNFYVRRLMQDLVSNLQYVNDKTPVAVTDFVLLDSDLQTTNLLGYQITESLTHEIHKFGIPVIDFKSTGYIRVTEEGDFLLTRNYEEISGNLPIRYVFTGTLTKHDKGYLVNAKVVGVSSQAIVGSAQSFIPNAVSDALISTEKPLAPETAQAVSLIQG